MNLSNEKILRLPLAPLLKKIKVKTLEDFLKWVTPVIADNLYDVISSFCNEYNLDVSSDEIKSFIVKSTEKGVFD